MKTVSAITALMILVPANLFYFLIFMMIVLGVIYGPDSPSELLLLIPLAVAYVPLFALNHLARQFVTGGIPALTQVRSGWWPIAFLWCVLAGFAVIYAAYRLLGGPIWAGICEPEDCPFGPTTSDIAYFGLFAIPLAVPVLHLWLMRRQYIQHAL